jgi:hypothetical protein
MMAEILKDDIDYDGYSMSLVVASAEDTFKNNFKNLVLIFKNTDASSHDVTLVAQNPCNQDVLHDKIITVGASSTVIVSDIDNSIFNDDNGMVHMTYDGNEGMFEVGVARVHSD